ncbi:MAG: hypothetical protein KAT48_13705 [Bacteroidales bacterium]|nr:hypothetical protein [Bacteroidales bacterium]
MFLILCESTSLFALNIAKFLNKLGKDTLILTPDDLAHHTSIHFQIESNDHSFSIEYKEKIISDENIDGVVNEINGFSKNLWPQMSEKDAEYAVNETHALWLSVLSILTCPVINPPSHTFLAGNFPTQSEFFHLCHQLGLRVPGYYIIESGASASPLAEEKVLATFTDLGVYPYRKKILSKENLLFYPTYMDHIRIEEAYSGNFFSIILVNSTFFCTKLGNGYEVCAQDDQIIPLNVKESLLKLQNSLNLIIAEYTFREHDDKWIILSMDVSPYYGTIKVHNEKILNEAVNFLTQKSSFSL